MKRKNTILKWVALSMALALIIMSLPVQALERSGIGTEDSISDLPFSGLDNNGDDDVFVVEEDQAKRGQFEKHYLCSDGTYVAVTYPEAVHYLGEDHTWQDVNLSLAYDDISGLYQNEMSDFAVSFSEKASGSEMVSIENGKYFLSWGIQISSVSISDMEGDANDLHSRTSEKSMAPQADICAKVGDMPISKNMKKCLTAW